MGNCLFSNLNNVSSADVVQEPAVVDDSVTRVPTVESVVSDTLSDRTVDINAMSEHSIDTGSVMQVDNQITETTTSEVVDSTDVDSKVVVIANDESNIESQEL